MTHPPHQLPAGKRKHDPFTGDVLAELEQLVEVLDDCNARGLLASWPESRCYRRPPAGQPLHAPERWQLWALLDALRLEQRHRLRSCKAKPGSLLEAFQLASSAGCLGQHEVACEAVILLSHYQRILPMHLQAAMVRLGCPNNYETGDQLARWLQDDGWIYRSVTPFAGKGMSEVPAYEPSEKWRKLLATHSRKRSSQASGQLVLL